MPLSEQISKIADELEMHALFDSDTAPALEQVKLPVSQDFEGESTSIKLEQVATALEA